MSENDYDSEIERLVENLDLEDDEDYSEPGPDTNFTNEFAVFERVGLPTANLGTVVASRGKKFDEIKKIINKAINDPTERFMLYVEAIARRLVDQKDFEINDDEIIFMLDHARDSVPSVGTKNPTAYILGYMASRAGRKNIEPEHVEKILDLLPEVEDKSVKPPDVIRYMRLWQVTTK